MHAKRQYNSVCMMWISCTHSFFCAVLLFHLFGFMLVHGMKFQNDNVIKGITGLYFAMK